MDALSVRSAGGRVSLNDAREIIAAWRHDYNHMHSHSSLGPLIGARPESLREAAVGGKTGPLTGPPKGVAEKSPNFLEKLGGGGGN